MSSIFTHTIIIVNIIISCINIICAIVCVNFIYKHKKRLQTTQKTIINKQQPVLPLTPNQVMIQSMHNRLDQLRYGTFSPIKSQQLKDNKK